MTTFAEVPDEISLCFSISNCKFHCPGCHSPWLWEDKGTELTTELFVSEIEKANGITCVCLMGGTWPEVEGLVREATHKLLRDYKWAWYTGNNFLEAKWFHTFDYIKVGPYVQELGGLNKPTTNQRMYKRTNHNVEDITYRFYTQTVE